VTLRCHSVLKPLAVYWRLAEKDKPEGWVFLRQPGGLVRDNIEAPWRENPEAENVQNLPPGYYLKGAQGNEEDWIKLSHMARPGRQAGLQPCCAREPGARLRGPARVALQR